MLHFSFTTAQGQKIGFTEHRLVDSSLVDNTFSKNKVEVFHYGETDQYKIKDYRCQHLGDPLREQLPSPVFWLGEFHGLQSPGVHKEFDTTEQP